MSNPSPGLKPARIDFSGPVARSLDNGDVHHSAEGGLAQAQHVFLGGNGLPQRWRGRRNFSILETGFGLGHNFLATWAAWRADPQRSEQLHFVSLEQHPPRREDLAKVHEHAKNQTLADRLVDAWPPLLQGLHVLHFEDAAVHLTLALGDARQLLPSLVGSFDAFFLDGFAPPSNPVLWGARLLRTLGRVAAPGATAATWCAAHAVWEGLQAAGFAVERVPGLGPGHKRHMSVARFAPRAPQRPPAGRPQGPWQQQRQAVIVGAGVAGATAAQALARQGWQCTVLDAATEPAQGASGNPAGLFHGVVHREDGVHARLHRHAALGAARHYGALIRERAVSGQLDGLLAVRDGTLLGTPGAPARGLDLTGYVQGLSQKQASEAAQAPLKGAALHYLQGGWVDPAGVVRHALSCTGVQFQGGTQVGALRAPLKEDDCWQVLDPSGNELARAPLVVLAAGVGLPVLAASGAETIPVLGPLEVTRGQITWFNSDEALARPVSGHGYAVRLPDGRLLCGASLRPDAADPELDSEDHRWNLERLQVLTGLRPAPGAALGGRVSWRLQTPDRLPLIGPVPAFQTLAGARQDQVRFIPRQAGLFVIGALGSRGLIWAPLAAQMLCAWVEATPMPLESELLDALDPARWWVRQARKPRPGDGE